MPFPATVTATMLAVASEKCNGNVTVGLALRQYKEVQYEIGAKAVLFSSGCSKVHVKYICIGGMK